MAGGTFKGLLWLEGRPSSIRSRAFVPTGAGHRASLMFIAHPALRLEFLGTMVRRPVTQAPPQRMPRRTWSHRSPEAMLNFHRTIRTWSTSPPGLRAPEHGRGGDPANELASGNAPLPTMVPFDAERAPGTGGIRIGRLRGLPHPAGAQHRNGQGVGRRPSIPSDYHYSKQRLDVWRQSPSLLGSERTGPDLTNIGKRQPGVQWHLLHLYDPRMVVQGRSCPAIPGCSRTATPEADAVVVPVPKDRLRDSSLVVVAEPTGTGPGGLPVDLEAGRHAWCR